MSRTRLFIALAALVVALAAVGWMVLTSTDPDTAVAPVSPAAPPTPEPTSEVAEAAAALDEEGPTGVALTLDVTMPPEFDDGLPERSFRGGGVVDMSQDLAAVDYQVDEVPNTAGYLGHVDGKLSVIYEGPRFMATFPVMADLLPGDIDWMSYQLSDLSSLKALSLGIGQLREIGLADPRLGLALLSSGFAETDPEGGTRVDLAQAGKGVPPDIWRVLQELQALGVAEMVLETKVDEAGRLSAYSYDLAYQPGEGDEQVNLSVRVRITRKGSVDDIEVPPDTAVQPYMEFLAAS